MENILVERSAKPIRRSASDSASELPMAKLRFDSLRLYGREDEVFQLREIYDNVCGRTFRSAECREHLKKQVVLISGYSGTGKSVLAEQLRNYVKRSGGFFISGKYEFKSRSTPYSAFSTAFTALCDEIISLKNSKVGTSAAIFVTLQSIIRGAVGPDADTLTEVIPNLPNILGNIGNQHSIRNRASRNQFDITAGKFVRAICSHTPLVLFLDDLQWMDMRSLELLKSLVKEKGNQELIIIGTFRENEIHGTSNDLAEWLLQADNLFSGDDSVAITRIQIGDLDVDTVNDMISDMLSSPPSDTKALAEVIHQKTHGNIFYVIQCLKNLQKQGILNFCFESFCWKWNMVKVKSGISISDNVADLMVTRMKNSLSDDELVVLQIAACLGSTFDVSLLELVLEKIDIKFGGGICTSASPSTLSMEAKRPIRQWSKGGEHFLQNIFDEGFLEKGDCKSKCNFIHDQIQQAALSLIAKEHLYSLQYHIGEVLWKNLSESEFDGVLFIGTDLLNNGTDKEIMDDDTCWRIAKLNLRAGERSMKSAAFGHAATYFLEGTKLLGANPWNDQYELTLDLFILLAEAEFFNGNAEKVQKYLDHILPNTKVPFKDKIRAYDTLISSTFFLKDESAKAIDLALHVLTRYSIHFPKKASKLIIVKDLLKTRHALKGLSNDMVLLGREMREKDKLGAMMIMHKLCELTFLSKSHLFTIITLKMVRWSVCYGVSKYSPGAFVRYGALLCTMGDIEQANEYGKLGISLVHRLQARDMDCEVQFFYYVYIAHWVLPSHQVEKKLFDGYKTGLKTGDIPFAFGCALTSCIMSVSKGRPLHLVEIDLKSLCQEMENYNQSQFLNYLYAVWQFILNLRGYSENPAILTGTAMNQKETLSRCNASEDEALPKYIAAHQLWISYFFKDYDAGERLMNTTKHWGKYFRSASCLWRNALFEGLMAFALARSTKRVVWGKHAGKVLKKVKKWVIKGNVNVIHALALLEAEKAALVGNQVRARNKYQESISMASRHGLPHDKALANERAGEFFLAEGDIDWASFYLSNACLLYSAWGAQAKVEHLIKNHGGLIVTNN